jgi:hypothetical protein
VRIRSLFIAVGVVVASVGISAAPAQAATATKATLSITKAVDAGSAVTVKYRVSGPKAGAKAVLQIKRGKTYKKVTTLAVTKTSKVVTAPSIGAYKYRVKVTLKSGRVLYSKVKSLHAYSDIQFGHVSTSALTDTVTLGGVTMQWWRILGLGKSSTLTKKTSCRYLTAQVGLESSTPGTLTITQAKAPDVTIALAPNSVTTQVVPLTGGASSAISGPNGYVYIGGTVNCYTKDGSR